MVISKKFEEFSRKFEQGIMNSIIRDGCTRPSNKVLRGLTKRPKFLDPHIETLHAVKGIVAKGIPQDSSAKVTVSGHSSYMTN